jgi:DNA-binding transcriptional MerR regulator
MVQELTTLLDAQRPSPRAIEVTAQSQAEEVQELRRQLAQANERLQGAQRQAAEQLRNSDRPPNATPNLSDAYESMKP